MKTLDRNGYDYARLLVRQKHRELRLLELRYRQLLIPSADYRSCRLSLLQAISQLESLLRDRPKQTSSSDVMAVGSLSHRVAVKSESDKIQP